MPLSSTEATPTSKPGAEPEPRPFPSRPRSPLSGGIFVRPDAIDGECSTCTKRRAASPCTITKDYLNPTTAGHRRQRPRVAPGDRPTHQIRRFAPMCWGYLGPSWPEIPCRISPVTSDARSRRIGAPRTLIRKEPAASLGFQSVGPGTVSGKPSKCTNRLGRRCPGPAVPIPSTSV